MWTPQKSSSRQWTLPVVAAADRASRQAPCLQGRSVLSRGLDLGLGLRGGAGTMAWVPPPGTTPGAAAAHVGFLTAVEAAARVPALVCCWQGLLLACRLSLTWQLGGVSGISSSRDTNPTRLGPPPSLLLMQPHCWLRPHSSAQKV